MTTIDVALLVLEEATRAAKPDAQQTAGVRLALRVLKPYAPKDWLVWYWEAAGPGDGITRQQNMQRCLNGIISRIRRP